MIRGTVRDRRIDRVRWAAKALQLVLKPTETHRPIILAIDRKRLEALCFGLNYQTMPDYRGGLETFGCIQVLGRHDAWIVNPLTPAQLDQIGTIDYIEDAADRGADASTDTPDADDDPNDEE